ncbi:MAG: hypothetical protein ACXWQO_17200, partial [Bdellovibrionota bacterium]
NYQPGLNGLIDSKERNLHFDKRNKFKKEGKLSEAVAEDLDYSRGLGFPSLYSMSQLEEYFAELSSFLIHDPSMQSAMPPPVVRWLAGTDLAFLMDPPLAEPMTNQLPDRRVDANGAFDFVGVLFLNDSPVCSVTILEHGIMVLARHCIDKGWFSEKGSKTKFVYLNVQFRAAQGGPVIRIDGSDFDQIGGDSGVNDLAYIRYSSALTSGQIKLPIFDFVRDRSRLLEKPALFTVGFPMPGKVQRLQRFVSSPCSFDGREGEQPGQSKIYHGPLLGTTCPAWYGSSGSLAFSHSDQPNHINVWGLLSHTFSSDVNGQPLADSIRTDAWGPYTDSNLSPFFLATDFPFPAAL